MTRTPLPYLLDLFWGRARWRRLQRAWLVLFLALGAIPDRASAQLAITEVMSNPSTDPQGFQRSDFWELTNFGATEVNLAGYRWMDADDQSFELRVPMPPTTIRPGESIIFAKKSNTVRDAESFREWWGANLPSDLQIHVQEGSPNPGFDADGGDAVRIWDAGMNLVDEVRFGPSQVRISFMYDPITGHFTKASEPGVWGAFRSALGQDIGSPGSAEQGPIPVRLVEQPQSQTVDAGSDLVLHARATGRPAPRFQWYFNGAPVTKGVTASSVPRLACYADCGPAWRINPEPDDLAIPHIQPHQAGQYQFEVFNGLTRATSEVVSVAVNTDPSPIRIECPPHLLYPPGTVADGTALVANPGQDVILTVRTRGYPAPAVQWSASGNGILFTNLVGATNQDLTLENVTGGQAGYYRVHLRNSSGDTTATAQLKIQPLPQLEITEVMALACTAPNRDWWELTNTGEESVNLGGFRWDDDPASIGGGPTIVNPVIVQPGESVIFLESQTAESFVDWWGDENLPPNLQFITYTANGLSEDGDVIYLWPPNETREAGRVTRVEYSIADPGLTRWWDLPRCPDSPFGRLSVLGQCGTFQAERGCEIGSPGWTRWTKPSLTLVRKEGTRTILNWTAQPFSLIRVQFARRLAVPPQTTLWEDLGEQFSVDAGGTMIDSTVGSEPQRFYRIVRIAPASCPCL